jgi:hypothetical protein
VAGGPGWPSAAVAGLVVEAEDRASVEIDAERLEILGLFAELALTWAFRRLPVIADRRLGGGD